MGKYSAEPDNATKAAKAKGQLILKCSFGVTKSTRKNNEIFVRISAPASKKRVNPKKIRPLYTTNWMILF